VLPPGFFVACCAAGYEFGLLCLHGADQEQLLLGWGCNSHGQAPARTPLLPGVRVMQLAAGERHALMLLADGSVLGLGDGGCGQLGPHCEAQPTRLALPARCVGVAAGARHSLFALEGRAGVASCGWGAYGQLGTGDVTDGAAPALLRALAGVAVTSVAAGLFHSLALSAGGDVYAWGRNDAGQLGLGPPEEAGHVLRTPQLLEYHHLSRGDVTAIRAGARHSAALRADGAVFCWGWAAHGGSAHGGGAVADVCLPALVMEGARDLQCGWWHCAALVAGDAAPGMLLEEA
jgi:alpha-tubulin suppressor-like RCC1 family protein